MRFDSFRCSRGWLLICGLGFIVFPFLVYRSTRQRLLPLEVSQAAVSQVPVEVHCSPDPPANWDKLYEWENNMPQHGIDLSPVGKPGRYLYFKNQIQDLGWNNVLNEVLMDSYLAYKSNRTYVFQDYLWSMEHYPWKNLEMKERPRIPLNALISGPTAGGPWDPTDPFPLSISRRFFDRVCPERRIINTREVKPSISSQKNGRTIFETWQKLLLEAPDSCIEIQPAEEDSWPQVFDLWFWGYGWCNDLWDEYRDSPVSRLLKTSPIVESAVMRNMYVLSPRGPKPPLGVSSDPFDRMIAVHLRRGDYEKHCMRLAQGNSTFYSWSLLSFLPDKFHHPPGWEVDQDETLKTYLAHCFPTEEQVTNKIRASRKDYVDAAKEGEMRYLDTVYILTNDQTEWVENLTRMLYDDGWNHVISTKELELDPQQKEVSMAVDMDVARRAAVFIGNGWSSFTSNIVHRRLVDRKEAISSRFF